MMSSLAINLDAGLATAIEGVSLLGLPTAKSAKRRLTHSADEVVRTISAILDEMVEDAIQNRTAHEFEAAVMSTLPRYMQLIMSVSQIVSQIVPKETMARVTAESFSELEADIRDQGLACFGSDLRDRALFTVWTLRKTADLLDAFERAAKLDPAAEAIDRKFYGEFMLHALRARFHVDCLTASMRTDYPLYPEVIPMIDDGLRSAVNAYAWAKQAVDLRFPSDESPLAELPWTADEQALLDDSMDDLESE